MPILLLIRHATNDFVKSGRLPGQTPNIHLNEEGCEQAEALGKLLRHRKLDAVYSSQLERAIETAWRIAAPHELPIHIRSTLADIDNGDFTGKVLKELSEDEATKEIWKVVVERPSEAKFPNGEAMIEMQQRVVAELERICAAHLDVEMPSDEQPKTTDDRRPTTDGTSSIPSASSGQAVNRPSSLNQAAQPKPEDEKPQKRPQVIAVVAHADPIKAALAHYLGMPFDNFQRLGVMPASVSTVMIGADEKTGKRLVMVMNVNQVAQ